MDENKDRLVIKIAGAAGQGIKTAGLIIAKALNRQGFRTFGYTEYPSLIRGGHNVFQIEIYGNKNTSLSSKIDLLLALDQPSIDLHYKEILNAGAIIYDENTIKISPEVLSDLQNRKVMLYPVKFTDEAKNSGGSILMKNTVALGSIWKVLKMDISQIQPLIEETYNKTPEMIAQNLKCLEAGFGAVKDSGNFLQNIAPNTEFKNNIFITGNEAIGLAAIASGVRLFVSYPMTPASSILTYLAKEGPKYGMIVKQAEDEITTAIMAIGAAHGGTRSMCATSGGGFDLMTESLSLAGMTETPFVCIIAQRPGPATGVPTWTAQGDLNLAVYAGHGEFPRIVLALSDPTDAFYLTNEACDLAEKYQTPVLILTDKYLAESNYSVPKYDMSKIIVNRGKVLSEGNGDDNTLRYETTEDGISPRWFPGDNISTFLSNSDEHDTKGYSTEDPDLIRSMMDKRAEKEQTILNDLPEPSVEGSIDNSDISIISWGSNRLPILNVIDQLSKEGIRVSYLHLTYLWPLRTEPIIKFLNLAKRSVIIECNKSAQLATLIKSQTGLDIQNKILKYDGRPFTHEELVIKLKALIQ